MKRNSVKDTQSAILDRCLRLFAERGFAGTSMRDIAREMDLSVAAVYHHFPSKRDLYAAVAAHAFKDKQPLLEAAVEGHGSPQERLRSLVRQLAQIVAEDRTFHAFYQRELLDADQARLQLLAKNYFYGPISQVLALSKEIAPDYDPYMVMTSVFGMVFYHYQLGDMHNYLPGVPTRYEDPQYVSNHIVRLVLEGFSEQQGAGSVKTDNVVGLK